MRTQYETDFYGWTKVQADALRTGALGGLDIPHLIEEIEDMGRSEQRVLTSRLEILLAHLLKWQCQPDIHARSWSLTIKEQRRKIVRHLQKNPSLKSQLAEIIEDAYGDATISVEREIAILSATFPPMCPWTWDEIVDQDFLPESSRPVDDARVMSERPHYRDHRAVPPGGLIMASNPG